jgi:hypothetical protein
LFQLDPPSAALEQLERELGEELDALLPADALRLAEDAFNGSPFLVRAFRRLGRRAPLLRPRLLRELQSRAA